MMSYVRISSWTLHLFLGLSLAGGCSSDSSVDPTDETGDSSGTDDTSGVDETTDSGLEPACGNEIVEAGEVCDEGGPTATCDDDCTPVTCGDGVANAAADEECDEGGSSATCDWDCTLAVCGDGLFNPLAGEACDDPGAAGACEADCTPIECGDGTTNAAVGEECDDAGESEACNSNCTTAQCGDGIANVTAGEACDDAGTSARCDEDCTAVACGDGVLNVLSELCEVEELVGATCEGLGFGLGTLACADGCQAYETSGCAPAEPVLSLSFSPVKRFDFSWAAVQGAEHYQVLESAAPGEPYVQLGGDVVGESVSFEVPLHLRWQASYVLRACSAGGCTESAPVDVVGSLAEAVGYVKASNTETYDYFGYAVALSGDGNTLAVGAIGESSNATGIGGNQADDTAFQAGAVYVFARVGVGAWTQQAYVKASDTAAEDCFGASVALSGDGNTLAVGRGSENCVITEPGAVHVLERDGAGAWSQLAYLQASNAGNADQFGHDVALSGDGNTLAVGAIGEDSSATGVGGNQANFGAPDSGAVFVFTRAGGAWSQQAYVKASNTGVLDQFGHCVALSADGSTLAVGARFEDSNATGVGGDQANDGMIWSGAVYVFVHDGGAWSQQAYVKASNTGAADRFGGSVALSGDGSTLAVGASGEDSSATGIGGNEADDGANDSGAAYVFERDGAGAWSQQAYVKSSATASGELLGNDVALSADGSVLAVGAFADQANYPGAVYVLERGGAGGWSQRAPQLAPNVGGVDYFGWSVSLSVEGNTLAVGAFLEDSSATGIGGDQANDGANHSGAVYLY